MLFIGLDLAWGQRNWTGLCAVDDSGRILNSGRARTDLDIVKWLAPFTSGDCLVAVDAPLIVPPDVRRRGCDNVISRVFGHREGSAHTANRHQPAFSKGVRAESLAKTLDLSTDPVLPSAAPVRRMIEVYPHTAILCLFRLPRTLKYKAKKGRTVASRKLAFRELIGHLQSVSGPLFQLASTHWQNLCSEIEQCRTSTTLDHAEDELDAYVCAYVALYYWTHRTARCGIIGDPEQGYIVTPIDDDARVRLRGLVSGG